MARGSGLGWAVAALLALGCGRTSPLVPLPTCELEVQPAELDLGAVAPGAAATGTVTVSAAGDGPCQVRGVGVEPADGGWFGLGAPTLPRGRLAAGHLGPLTVSFAAFPAPTLPGEVRTRAWVLSDDATTPRLEVPVRAKVKGCELAVVPAALELGSVRLHAHASGPVRLENVGDLACTLSAASLAPDGDVGFSLAPPPLPLPLAPGERVSLTVRFAADDSAPPHLRRGTLRLAVDDPRRPSVEVPLSAFVNTVCTEAGQYIYTVDLGGMLARFDPRTLTSVDVGQLACPSPSTPFSMNLDQEAVAWVIFSDEHLYRVDTATAACTATSYLPAQHGFLTFGMGSVFDAATGQDTFYLASDGNGTPAGGNTLGTLAFPSLQVSVVGPLTVGRVELAGTGDGQLWAFAPAGASLTGHPGLWRLDPATAGVLETYDLSDLTSRGGYAIKFWGDAFYVFVGSDIWRVDRSSLDPRQPRPSPPPVLVLRNPGRDVVGAGVSTCAPVH